MNHGLLRCCDVGLHLYPESQHYAESARSLEARETVVGVSTHQWQGRILPFIPRSDCRPVPPRPDLSVRDSLTLLRYRLWAVTGSAEDALRRLMPP